jgi:Putative ATPase subunit of terminase (gpP-like).
MAKTTEKKAKKQEAGKTEIKYAEMLYVEKGLSPQAIADELNRNIKTIYSWRDKHDWDSTKELFQAGPTELKKILLKEAVRIAKGEARKDNDGNEIKGIDADSLSKVMKAYDYMNSKLSIEIIRDVLIKRDYWMTGIDPKRAAEDTKYNRMFLQDLISTEI